MLYRKIKLILLLSNIITSISHATGLVDHATNKENILVQNKERSQKTPISLTSMIQNKRDSSPMVPQKQSLVLDAMLPQKQSLVLDAMLPLSQPDTIMPFPGPDTMLLPLDAVLPQPQQYFDYNDAKLLTSWHIFSSQYTQILKMNSMNSAEKTQFKYDFCYSIACVMHLDGYNQVTTEMVQKAFNYLSKARWIMDVDRDSLITEYIELNIHDIRNIQFNQIWERLHKAKQISLSRGLSMQGYHQIAELEIYRLPHEYQQVIKSCNYCQKTYERKMTENIFMTFRHHLNDQISKKIFS